MNLSNKIFKLYSTNFIELIALFLILQDNLTLIFFRAEIKEFK